MATSFLPALRLASAAVLLGSVACGDVTARVSLDGSVAGGDCTGPSVLDPLPEMPEIAVVLSDYSSTAVALLDENGELLAQRWVDSGTRSPQIVASLSGDVLLPTVPRGDGSLTLIDRYLTDVVSRFCAPGGQLAGQGRARRGGSSTNPYDLTWHDGIAWVTRFGVHPAEDPLDRGNDLYALDGASMAPRSERIDLGVFDAPATLGGGAGSSTPVAHARPSSIVKVGNVAVVGLSRLSPGFLSAAPGAVAIVDLTRRSSTLLPLERLANCGKVVPVAGRGDAVVVACNGFPDPFEDDASRRATAGLVQLRVDADGEAHVEAAWHAASFPTAPLSVFQPVSVGDGEVVASSWGDVRLVRVQLREGTSETVDESADLWEFGLPYFDGLRGELWVPDARRGLLRFVADEAEPSGFRLAKELPLGLSLGLPPRQVARL